jgi:GDP-mannose 6-dehydrogenase
MSKYFGKKIILLGLSFKAGTDDLRNSPYVDLVESLLGKGFDLMLYDDNIKLAKLTGKNKEYIDKKIPHLTDLLSEKTLKETIDSGDVIIVCNREQQFLAELENTTGKIIFDMVGVSNTIRENNKYIGINW